MKREDAKLSLEKAIKAYLENELPPSPYVLSEIVLTHCESVLGMIPPKQVEYGPHGGLTWPNGWED